MICPRCGLELSGLKRCRCGADLPLLRQLSTRADVLFNEALVALGAGRVPRALECLEANAVLAPFDIVARLSQVKLLIRSGRWQEAMGILHRLQDIDPGHREVKTLVELVSERRKEVVADGSL